jgi:hypothetical protein
LQQDQAIVVRRIAGRDFQAHQQGRFGHVLVCGLSIKERSPTKGPDAGKADLPAPKIRVRQMSRSPLNPLVAGDFYRRTDSLAFIGAST